MSRIRGCNHNEHSKKHTADDRGGDASTDVSARRDSRYPFGKSRRRATGLPLAGANVVLLDVDNGSTVSEPDGRYLLIDVLSGTYRLRVSFIGYGQMTEDDVTAVADRSTRIDVTLTQVDLESETLEVVTLAPLIQLDRTSSWG